MTTMPPSHNVHIAQILDLGDLTVPDPTFGDLRLAVFPFTHDGKTQVALPEGFSRWEATLHEMMAHVPVQDEATQFFVTIDTKFFTSPGFLRREGVHMDGNFCADPSFSPKASWGGDKDRGTWAGLVALSDKEMPDNSHVQIGFAMPYDLTIPVGRYVSGEFGGTLVASSYEGCQAWPGVYVGEVGSGGDWSEMESQLGTPVTISAHRLWFMTSNCPHETTLIPQGARRTFIRVTFPHNYRNAVLVG